MRKTSHALVLAGAIALPSFMIASSASAADAAAAPASPHTFTANVNLVSEYRFRGIDQTWGQPALQGGADYSHSDGWYAGLWGSNVSGNTYAGGSLELDYYAGYNGKFTDDLGWTVGGFGYYYPGANFNKAAAPGANQTFDNFEVNAGLSWKWISYKLSVSTTDYFGANTKTGYTSGTKGSLYHDLSLNYPLADDLTLGFHVGRTDVKAMYGTVNPDYTDYKLSLAKTFQGGWNASLAYVQSTNDAFFKNTQSLATTATNTRGLNKGVLVLQAGRTF
ncbi:MAG: TorF family putative porin [Sulfuricella sp.]|nr:TorF family putative porin [Sulfuricella sp.]